ncbi:MAG: OmpA family protein [Oligoflexales bacterium]|nr:OmpA family protein [Oligoflexales bacterium]
MWIISYADLMTLLFATFVVLYGLKSEGETKEIRGVVSSIREAFIEIPDQIDDPDVGPTSKGINIFKNWKLDYRRESLIKRFKRNRNTVNVIDEELEKVRKLIEPDPAQKIKRYFRKEKPTVSVYREGENIVVSIGASMLYEGNSYRLKRAQIKNLQPLASYLASLDKDIIIQAYAKKQGTSPSGIGLASLRATYLMRYLTRNYQVPIRRLMPYGYELPYNDSSINKKESPNLGNRVDLKIIYE